MRRRREVEKLIERNRLREKADSHSNRERNPTSCANINIGERSAGYSDPSPIELRLCKECDKKIYELYGERGMKLNSQNISAYWRSKYYSTTRE